MTDAELVKSGRWKVPKDSICDPMKVVEGTHELILEARANPEKYLNHECLVARQHAREVLRNRGVDAS